LLAQEIIAYFASLSGGLA